MFKAAFGPLVDSINQPGYFAAWESRRFRTQYWDLFVRGGAIVLLFLWSDLCEGDAASFPEDLRIPEEPLPF